MRYQTHVVTTAVAGLTTAHILDISLTAPLVIGAVIGSVFPDIDEPGSYIGRRSLGASRIINLLFGHRGLTHSLLPVALLVLLCFKFPIGILMGFTFGYLFHIVGDLFSKSGVPLFLPFSQKKTAIPIYTTGGIIEHVIFVLFTIYLLQLLHVFDITKLF